MFRSFVSIALALSGGSTLAASPYRGGAVAAANPLASEAGREMLDAKGNAVDAAVASALVMAVVGPYHSGLGGGGFAVLHLVRDGRDLALDFREVAPGGATKDMYLRDGQVVSQLATDGALSVAVPGAVKGYLELQASHGVLPRERVFRPAIRIARAGFPVTPKYRELAARRIDCLRADPESARLFLRPDGSGVPQVPPVGTLIRQPELARTLESLAKGGEKVFYQGPLAKALVETVAQRGGVLTQADLAAYRVRWRAPLTGSYRGHRLVTMPPPSAGGVTLLQVLGVLESYGPQGVGSRQVDLLHVTLEALRRAYVDRARFLGDPAFHQVPLERLLSPEYLEKMLQSIDPKRATPSVALMPPEWHAAPPPAPKPHGNTTHISVVDEAGNAVALTTTLNYAFGSCLTAKGTGILLNDQMDDFACHAGVPNAYGLVAGEANAIAPGKVPISSMTPTLVFQKEKPTEVMLAVGSPGGSTIPTTVLQVISLVVDHRLDVGRAVSAGRFHHQWLPDQVLVDSTALEPATQAALTALGHTVVKSDGWGDAEAVMVDPVTGLRTAGSDPRNEGAPAGQR